MKRALLLAHTAVKYWLKSKPELMKKALLLALAAV